MFFGIDFHCITVNNKDGEDGFYRNRLYAGFNLTGIKSLEKDQVQVYMNSLFYAWRLYGNRRLTRGYEFESHKRVKDFMMKIELLAEQQQHYPFVCISYPKVMVELSSYDRGRLSENDFIMATKIDELYVKS